MQKLGSAEKMEDLQPVHELLQAVIQEDYDIIQEILADSTLSLTKVNWQDQLGWTPLIYAAFRGDFRLVNKLISRGATINHMALSRSGSGADGTTPLHACAAMRPGSRTTKEGFYEAARILMLAGGNPYQENLSGLTPIDVAANRNNIHMKVLLEGCALFKGTLTLPIAKLFGGKLMDRYCLVLPRFAWHPLGNQNGLLMRDGHPTLSLVCYKAPDDPKPLARIPLDGARVVIEGGSMTEEGFLIVKASRKQLKGISVKSSTSNSCVIEIRAKPSATQTAGQVLQSLAEVCKSAAVAAYCGNLGQLCEASMVEALHNLGLEDGLLPLPGFQPVEKQLGPMSTISEGRPVAPEMLEELKQEEEPQKSRRKSMSLSRFGRAAMRRLSIGDKPRRKSLSMERTPSGERMQDTYGSTRVRQQASILADFSSIQEDAQEEEAPVDWGRISKDLHSPERRRLSLQVDNLGNHKKESRRHSLSSRYAEGREILVSNQGIPMDFWGGMRDRMMRRSIDNRPMGLNARSQGQLPVSQQPANVRGSFDVGDLDDLMSPAHAQSAVAAVHDIKSGAAERAAGLLDARRPVDSTMQDWVQQAAEVYGPELYEQWKEPSTAAEPHAAQAGLVGGIESRAQQIPKRRNTSSTAGKRDEPNRGALPTPSDAPVTPSPTKGTRPKRDEAPSTSKELPPLSGSTRRSSRISRDENAQRIAGRYPSSGPDAVVANATEGPEPFQGRPLPVVNLSNIPTNRSEKSRSSGRAPRPASKHDYSSSEWFSSAGGEDDLFHWTLRPEHRAPRNVTAPSQPAQVVAAKSQVDPAVAQWAAEAAAMVKDEPEVTVAAVDELAQAGWREALTVQKEGPGSALTKQPSGEDLPSLAEKDDKLVGSKSAGQKDSRDVPEEGNALQERIAVRRANKNPSLMMNAVPPPPMAAANGAQQSEEQPSRSESSSSSYFSDSSSKGRPTRTEHIAIQNVMSNGGRQAKLTTEDSDIETFHSPARDLPAESA